MLFRPRPAPRTWLASSLRWAWVALACLLTASDVQQPAIFTYGTRPEVQAFIQSMATRHAFEPKALSALLGGLRPNAEAIELVKPPAVTGRKNWRVYRSRFVEPQRIRAGVAFWKEHAATLARIERESGVPAEIIVGILGVETIYGRNMGRFPVLEVLATLSFDYPETPNQAGRSTMFLHELEEYLVWCRDTHQDATTFTGSYTGAIGIPQFLPSSIRGYAVDHDGDGRVNLRDSVADAIGSVASYLKAHGWEPGRPAVWRLAPSRKSLSTAAARADGEPEPTWRMGELLDAGIQLQGLGGPRQLKAFRKKERDTKVLLIDLPTPDRPTEYQLGLKNFHVITRYNRSFFYAMAVVDLGKAVKDALKRK